MRNMFLEHIGFWGSTCWENEYHVKKNICLYIYVLCVYIYISYRIKKYISYTIYNQQYTYIICIICIYIYYIIWHIIETLPVSDVPINHQLWRLPLRQGTAKLAQWLRASKRFSNNSDTVARPNLVWRIFMELYHVIITTRKIVFGDIYI